MKGTRVSTKEWRGPLSVGMAAVLLSGLVTGTAAADRDGIAGFDDQRADWHQCSEPPPPEPSEQPDDGIIIDPWQGQWGQLECATVVAPRNYREPGDGNLGIEVSRTAASDPASRKGVVLFNPGGPGGGGLAMPLQTRGSELAKHF